MVTCMTSPTPTLISGAGILSCPKVAYSEETGGVPKIRYCLLIDVEQDIIESLAPSPALHLCGGLEFERARIRPISGEDTASRQHECLTESAGPQQYRAPAQTQGRPRVFRT